jgi:hypothetical protein
MVMVNSGGFHRRGSDGFRGGARRHRIALVDLDDRFVLDVAMWPAMAPEDKTIASASSGCS